MLAGAFFDSGLLIWLLLMADANDMQSSFALGHCFKCFISVMPAHPHK